MRRGELWTAAANTDYASKPRPVLILQADDFLGLESIIVLGLTSDLVPGAWFRPLVEPSPDNGLRRSSQIMIDKMQAIPSHKIRDRIGNLTEEDMALVDRALLIFLGLADSTRAAGAL